ncbi:MAG: NB-ARC domain-containing protein [Gemmataceae bacterium]
MRPDREAIKALRLERGWSQWKLAEKAEVDESTIKNVERGRTRTTHPDTLASIARALEVDPGRIRLATTSEPTRAEPLLSYPPRHLAFDPLSVQPRLPTPPDRFLGRDGILGELIDRAFQVFDPEPSQRTRNRTLLRGEGGNGKTTLVRALLNDHRVAHHFGGNRLWATLGPGGDPRQALAHWCQAWGAVGPPADAGPEAGRDLLTARIGGRPVLIVIDDVWEDGQLIPLTVGGGRCAIIVTTRLTSMAFRFAPDERDIRYVGRLAEEDAVDLLRVLAGPTLEDRQCREIAQAVRGHALALELAGLQIRTTLARGQSAAEFVGLLRTRTEEILKLKIPRELAAYRDELERDPTLFGLYRLSTGRLDDRTHWRLAVAGNLLQPDPSHFDVGTVADLWETDEADARETISCLVGEGLLQVVQQGRYQIHQMLAFYSKLFMREDRES